MNWIPSQRRFFDRRRLFHQRWLHVTQKFHFDVKLWASTISCYVVPTWSYWHLVMAVDILFSRAPTWVLLHGVVYVASDSHLIYGFLLSGNPVQNTNREHRRLPLSGDQQHHVHSQCIWFLSEHQVWETMGWTRSSSYPRRARIWASRRHLMLRFFFSVFML